MKTDQHTILFESERPRLTSIAYRMLGRWTEAEDIVQDAFLRWQVADHAALQSPQAWLTTVVTRLSIDRIRRNRASRTRVRAREMTCLTACSLLPSVAAMSA